MATTTAEKTTVSDSAAPDAFGFGPLPDPPPMMDMLQEPHNTNARAILRTRYAGDPTVLVTAEAYLTASRSASGTRLVPDCMVSFGVNADAAWETEGYVIDELGKPPDFVLEVASKSTARRDYRTKPEIYERMGAGEYWLFDYTGGDIYPETLAGYILSPAGLYVPIETREDAEGGIWAYSPALGLRLYWDDGALRFYDPETDEFLLDHREEHEGRLAERRGRILEREGRLAERQARLAERNARLAAEAENERLRRLVNRLRGE